MWITEAAQNGWDSTSHEDPSMSAPTAFLIRRSYKKAASGRQRLTQIHSMLAIAVSVGYTPQTLEGISLLGPGLCIMRVRPYFCRKLWAAKPTGALPPYPQDLALCCLSR